MPLAVWGCDNFNFGGNKAGGPRLSFLRGALKCLINIEIRRGWSKMTLTYDMCWVTW